MDSHGLVWMRFKPTNEEIVFLLKMKRLDPDFSVQTIKEIDIYSSEPWELPRFSEIQSKEEVWYFYCEPYYKYAKSKRAHRRTKSNSGYWKVTGKGSDMKAKNSEVIATKKILTFDYCGRGIASKRAKAEWVMHEIAVKDDNPRYKKDFVVCRLERKRNKQTGVSTSVEDLASCSNMDVTGDIFSESVVLPDQHMISNINHVAENISSNTQLLPSDNQISYSRNHVAENSVSNGNHVAENTSKGLQLEPNDNLESPKHLAPYSTNIVGYSFEAEPPPLLAEFNPHGGYNGLNNTSISRLQSPIYPEQESSYSNGSSYGSDLLNSLLDSEQVDYLINSLRAFQKETSLEETGQTFTPDFNSSKSDEYPRKATGQAFISDFNSSKSDEYSREATGQAFTAEFNSSKSDGRFYLKDSLDEDTESFIARVKELFEN